MNFKNLGLRAEILRAIEELGYEEATPIQQKAIPSIVDGRDLIGSAQTGTGKTATFALPTLHRLQGTADAGHLHWHLPENLQFKMRKF